MSQFPPFYFPGIVCSSNWCRPRPAGLRTNSSSNCKEPAASQRRQQQHHHRPPPTARAKQRSGERRVPCLHRQSMAITQHRKLMAVRRVSATKTLRKYLWRGLQAPLRDPDQLLARPQLHLLLPRLCPPPPPWPPPPHRHHPSSSRPLKPRWPR